MKNSFNHKCLSESVYEKYYIEETDGQLFVAADLSSGTKDVCLFDNAPEAMVRYLSVGYNVEKGEPVTERVLDFISRYGFSKRGTARESIDDFAEDAQALYLHCVEILGADYPENPEWILETEKVKAIIKRSDGKPFIEWQTKNLSAAVELAYTLLICGADKYLGICKHCGKPFLIKNPKTEFCSAPCRNRYNVYKTRAKK